MVVEDGGRGQLHYLCNDKIKIIEHPYASDLVMWLFFELKKH